MKRHIAWAFIVIAIYAFVVTACKKVIGESNDEEIITTMVITCTPQGGGTPLVFTFDDADGPGGNNPTVDNIALNDNTTYDVSVTLLNSTLNPPDDITEEVEEENTAHRFYYEASAGSNIIVSNLNNDDDGVPLGTTSTWTTAAAGTGTITITLRHYPGNPPDKQIPDPVNSPKSATDISVTFNTVVN